MIFRRARGHIRPIELGRRLVREMDDNRSVDVKGRRIVPNHFTVRLSGHDHAEFTDMADMLTVELTEAAREYAREEGYHFVGPVRVELEIQNDLKPGRFGVVSELRQGSAMGTGAGALILPSGERITLGPAAVSVGRLPECTVTLDDHNVSRRHAEIRAKGSGFAIVDTGSTNGTMVNGAKISGERILADGDIVSFGSAHVRFEAS